MNLPEGLSKVSPHFPGLPHFFKIKYIRKFLCVSRSVIQKTHRIGKIIYRRHLLNDVEAQEAGPL